MLPSATKTLKNWGIVSESNVGIPLVNFRLFISSTDVDFVCWLFCYRNESSQWWLTFFYIQCCASCLFHIDLSFMSGIFSCKLRMTSVGRLLKYSLCCLNWRAWKQHGITLLIPPPSAILKPYVQTPALFTLSTKHIMPRVDSHFLQWY